MQDVEFKEGEDIERVWMDDDSEGEEYETEVDDDNSIPEGEKVTEDCQIQGSHIDTMQSGPKLPPE